VLDAFAKQSGLQIIYRVDEIRGIQSDGVRRQTSAEKALATILAGTEFTGRRDSSGAIAIERLRARVRGAELSGAADTDPAQPYREEIIVTGTRIQQPDFASSLPLVSFTREELQKDGQNSLGDALSDLPSLRSSFTTANTGEQGIESGGLNVLDLRGLGLDRTLVLVNGRRHVTGFLGDFLVDVNTLPLELLSRVDIVTGGSSAVYGSDAIAGVVNFVTRRDFEGAAFNAQTGLSSRGDNAQYRLGATIGKNFAGGRGNVSASIEYTRSQAVRNTQRPQQSGAFDGVTQFVTVENGANEPGNTDGIADTAVRTNLRRGFLSDGGTVEGFCVSNQARQPLSCNADGSSRRFRFQPDGRLVEAQAPVDTLPFAGNSFEQGGDGSTGRNTGFLFPSVTRFNANLLTRFDVSDAFRVFGEFKFARVNSVNETQPTQTNGVCDPTNLGVIVGLNPSCARALNGFAFVRLDNAFLQPEAAAQIAAFQNELLGLFGAPPIARGIFVNRNNVDFGARQTRVRRETYRALVGLEGRFNDDWTYEISANYGRLNGSFALPNNLLRAEFNNALDSVRGPGGVPVCRINVDANTSNDDPSCAPINIFGAGAPSRAALDYVTTDASRTERAEQFGILGFVNGDTSQWFEAPGGPVRFVIGGEYRREKARAAFDDVTTNGLSSLGNLPPFRAPAFAVKEVFGEVEVPILADLPFVYRLGVSGALRYSDYNRGAGNTGGTVAYNFTGTYAPSQDIRFRINYSRSVRAPTPRALFSAQSDNFQLVTDPCSGSNINLGSSSRLTNCRSDNPIARVPVGLNASAAPLLVTSGGNINLEEEKSDSWSVGTVVQPRFIPGLSITADYYNITVRNAIELASASGILANCYDSAAFPNNQFCDLINPRQASGNLNLAPALRASTVNFAKLVAKGVDVAIQYQTSLGGAGMLSLRGVGTYVINRNNFLDIENPDVPDRIKGELGDPSLAANFSASYKTGNFELSYGLRYIGRQTIGAFEQQFGFNGQPALNPDLTNERFYRPALYHNARIDFSLNNQFSMYLGINNITDRLPQFGLTGTGNADGIFNNIGRAFFAGIRASL
jgi:outer membrane receptor protein involved in Fe transport